jgi:hypothetical protein
MTAELLANPFSEQWSATSPSDTHEEAVAKERAFQEAQQVSRLIDEKLLESKKALEKKKKAAQILLLGVSYPFCIVIFHSNLLPLRAIRVGEGI